MRYDPDLPNPPHRPVRRDTDAGLPSVDEQLRRLHARRQWRDNPTRGGAQ